MNTYTYKQVRKLEKKARDAEGRYHETQDEEYLRKRDRFNDEVNILKRNVAMNKKNITSHVKIGRKTCRPV